MSRKPAIEIVPGMVFGRLTTIEIAPKGKRGVERWHIKCTCGTEKVVGARYLREDISKSCGCLRNEKIAEIGRATGKANAGRKHAPHFESLVGRVFGRLTVIEMAGRTPARAVLWRCACSCGSSKIVVRDSLIQGATQSCGCLRNELNAENLHSGLHTGKLRFEGRRLSEIASETGLTYAALKHRLKKHGTCFPDHLPRTKAAA